MRVASFSLLAALIIVPAAGAQISTPNNPGNRLTAAPALPPPQTPDRDTSRSVSPVSATAQLVGAAVKGLPFSATETIVETLADGTTIKNRSEVLLSRDAEGRCRGERADPQMQGRDVTVTDPAARTVMFWSSSENMSWISEFPVVWVMHLPDLKSVKGPLGIVLSTHLPPPPSRAMQSSSNIDTETLPAGNIAGLYVEGTRTTEVIPAGAAGNDRDITVTSETWTSPELRITVRQVKDDPRTGKVTTELTNIDRSDPAPSLFKPPVGYAVVDNMDVLRAWGIGTLNPQP